MATGRLLQPGVTVLQELRTASPTFVRPTLVPCVVGPAFELVNLLTSDGTVNPKALYGSYAQVGSTIVQTSFPDPRGNVTELNILEETIRPFLSSSGNVNELPIRPTGKAFLTTSHLARKAGITSAAFGAGLAIGGQTLVLAIDQPVENDTSDDMTVIFTGTTLTAAEAADQINTQTAMDIASVVSTDKVLIASPTFGARSSVTVRGGGTANALLVLGYNGGSNRHERVVGAGYCGSDDNDGDTLTPWVTFAVGGFFAGTVYPLASLGSPPAKMIQILIDGTETSTVSTGVTFGTSGVPVLPGDYFYADGIRINSGEIMKVESSRFKIGTINTSQSETDTDGNYTTKVYDTTEVETLKSSSSLSPKYVYFVANGLDADVVAPTRAVKTGSVVGVAAKAGFVQTDLTVDPANFVLDGLTLHYVVEIDGVETDAVYTFTGGPFADMAAVITALGTSLTGLTPTGVTTGGTVHQLNLATTKTGRLQSVTVMQDGTANLILGFPDDADRSSKDGDVADHSQIARDIEISGLSGETLTFTLDDNPHAYATLFNSDSLVLACEEINENVGATVATIDNSRHLVITSTLYGLASKVAADTNAVAGFNNTAVLGTGRPYPDAYLNDQSELVIGSQILRELGTGYPLDPTYNPASLYIQYKALRRDVTVLAAEPGVVRIPDTTTLSTVLDPLTEENPAGLAMYLMMINAPGLEAKFLGVDEITASAPEGTPAAYSRAAGMLEAEEVYALAPLSKDEVVHGLFRSHVLAMSEPEQGGERIVFINKAVPVRANPTIFASGADANNTTTDNQVRIGTNPVAAMVAAGLDPSTDLPYSDLVFIQLEVDGDVRYYNVENVSNTLITFRTVFATGENADGFFSTVTFNGTLVNGTYSLKMLGDSLVIPGSNPARYDYGLIADNVAEANAGLATRRVYSVFPDTIKTMVNGVEKSLPGYYACAATAGMVAALSPQQGFTNYPITGITGVVGTERYNKNQLDTMAGGGTYILMQEVPGGPVMSRHQVSTDLTSIETRELSITKSIDFVAKFLRLSIRKFIGTHTVNTQLLDTISATVNGVLAFLVDVGILNGANLNNIAQDTSAPDTVLIDVTLDLMYPCNYIRLTLVV
jgi:hypothetical protein